MFLFTPIIKFSSMYTSWDRVSYFFNTVQREKTLNVNWVTFWRENADGRLCSPHGFCNFNYWAWVIKLKSCLQIVMPFTVPNDCLTTSPHRCTGVRSIQYTWLAVTRPCNNGLDCYLVSPEARECSTFDRPQGFRNKGKNGVPPGRILRDQNSGIFLSRRDIWHVCSLYLLPFNSYCEG